jgi:hypothetical protein
LIPAVYVFIDKDNVKVADAGEKNVVAPAAEISRVDKATASVSHKSSERTTKEKVVSPATGDFQSDKAVSNGSDKNEVSITNEKIISPASIDLRIKNKVSSALRVTNNQPVETNYAKAWTNFPLLLKGYTINSPSASFDITDQKKSFIPENSSSSVPKADKKKKTIKGLYYGITASPDLSTIKGQAIKGVGYSAGIVVGYNINSHFAVESGAIWSKKKYYTDGKYFSKAKAGIPDYIYMQWLDGGCEMFEFPLLVRYNFKPKKNTFFVSTGLTSYLMKKEEYKYSATAGASGSPYEGSRAYNRSGDHLFANLQLSAGYNLSVSPKMNLRIEPYLKAPLKKIGIGNMPVTSTGLYLSLTRDFR